MPKTIVSCAPCGVGNGPNFGMLTVDYAIYNLTKNLPKEKVVCSAPWQAFSPQAQNIKIKERVNFPEQMEYNLHAMEALEEGDRVLYWGDFQWGRDYQTQSTNRLQKNILPGKTLNFSKIIHDRFMLRKYFEERKTTIDIMSYGTTLFQNRLADFTETAYRDNLHWLIQNSSFIKFRDPYSAQYCAGVRGDFEHNYQGVDAALLNTKAELLHFETGDNAFVETFNGQIGYYFGRSSSAFPSIKVARFLGSLCRDFNKKLVKIPWTYFTKGLFVDSMDKYLQFTFTPIAKPPMQHLLATDVLKAMDACSLIVTDTYHIAINAIALHKPVIIFPEFRSAARRDANMGYIEAWRDKRVLLFLGNSLADLMVNPDLCSQKHYKNAKLDIVDQLLATPELINHLYGHIHELAKKDRATLTQILNQ
jgi:hypothetical protein